MPMLSRMLPYIKVAFPLTQAVGILISALLFVHGHHIGAEGVMRIGRTHAHIVVRIGTIMELYLTREIVDARMHIKLRLVVLIGLLVDFIEAQAYLVAILGIADRSVKKSARIDYMIPSGSRDDIAPLPRQMAITAVILGISSCDGEVHLIIARVMAQVEAIAIREFVINLHIEVVEVIASTIVGIIVLHMSHIP